MVIHVTNILTDKLRSFSGNEEELKKDLLHAYPFLVDKAGWHASLNQILDTINKCQSYSAESDVHDDLIFKNEESFIQGDHVEKLLGYDDEDLLTLEAAAFLAGIEPPLDEFYAILGDEEHAEHAALEACKLDPVPENYAALRAIVQSNKEKPQLKKFEEESYVKYQKVEPFSESDVEYAKIVQQCIDKNRLTPIKLGGKHSVGTELAKTDTGHILLKPGSGANNPSAGVRSEKAGQSRREAAFWEVANLVGLGETVPETHLLIIDGKEVAAIQFLPQTFKTLKDIKKTDPGSIRRILSMHLSDGSIHKWAALDWICGNVDCHGGNVMARGDEIKLIDHGSCFAGDAFSPATDKYAFIPFYLRAFAPSGFKAMSAKDKLRYLPRVDTMTAHKIGQWVESIDEKELSKALTKYGIDPGPSLRRLEILQMDIKTMAADLALNSAWSIW